MALSALISISAHAHAHLEKSNPADGSVITSAPANFALEFEHPVRVTALTIQKEDGKSEPLTPVPQEATTKVSVPAPKLSAGKYVVSWRAVSSDNHIMSGKIQFTIAPENADDHAAHQ
jgi:copper transport protein